MKFTSVALYGAALGLAHANPVAKRSISDADILNYALTLEHLEATFYAEGLKNYTRADFVNAGMNDPFYANLQEVASDEKTHVSFLTQALTAAGAKPVEACTYAFPSTDVNSFLALASVLEGVGVSAYLGAAASIADKTYLTAAGSILTVEARHNTYLRSALGEAPFAQPFDTPLDFDEVYTMASPFFVSCPSSNAMLPVKAFPSLTMESASPAMSGSTVKLMPGAGFDMSMDMSNVYAAFISVTGPIWAPITSNSGGVCSVTIPAGVAGQSYVVLTKGNTQATDNNILAGPAIVEVGALMGPMGTGSKCGKPMPSMSMSKSMPMSTPMASASRTMSPGSMTSSTMMASTSPAYNAASGISPSGVAGVFMMVAAALFMQ